MQLLVLDVETTGLVAGQDRIVEVGAAVFSTEHKGIIWAYSTLVNDVQHNPIPEINHITDGMLKVAADVYARQPVWAEQDGPLAPILQLCDCGAVDIVAAHHAVFDRAFIDSLAGNPPLLRGPEGRPIPWICTEENVRYPKQKRTAALRYLAVDHDVAIGGQKHRALADVLLCCELLALVPDLDDQIRNGLKPSGTFQALVGYEQRELAKQAGFRWNGDAKRWEKRLPRDTPLDASDGRPFRIQPV